MIARKQGKIINLASFMGLKAKEGIGLHNVCKAAVIMLTRVLAVEMARYNIQVNAIGPSLVCVEHMEKECNDPEFVADYVKMTPIPVGRLAYPADIVGTAVFLASSASDYITGQTIVIDGGALA